MQLPIQLFVLFAIFASCYGGSSVWGVRNSTDAIVLTKNLFRPPVSNRNQVIFFDVPESYHTNAKVISAIYLQDRFQNSSGPVSVLVSGGPGWTYATLQLRTSTSIGLNVTIVVYGKLTDTCIDVLLPDFSTRNNGATLYFFTKPLLKKLKQITTEIKWTIFGRLD